MSIFILKYNVLAIQLQEHYEKNNLLLEVRRN